MELSVSFSVCACADCGITFATTRRFNNDRIEDHETFYCPRGHKNYYPQLSDKEKLERQVKECRVSIDYLKTDKDHLEERLEKTELRRRAQKAATTRIIKKAKGER